MYRASIFKSLANSRLLLGTAIATTLGFSGHMSALVGMSTSGRLFIPPEPPGGRLWHFLYYLPSSGCSPSHSFPSYLALDTLSATCDSVPGTGTLGSEVTLMPTSCPSLVDPSRRHGMSTFGGLIRRLIVWGSQLCWTFHILLRA